MANNNTDFQVEEDMDLGLDINLGSTNLFEQFHKDKAAGDSTSFKPAKTDDDDSDDPNKNKAPEKKTDDKDDVKDKVEFKTESVLDMVKNHFTKDEDDDPSKKKPAAAATKTTTTDDENPDNNVDPNTLGVFKTIYEHLTENLGYNALKEGEFDGTPESFDKWLETEKEELAFSAGEQLIEESFINNPRPENKGVAVDLFNFLKNGGLVADFVETRKYDTITPEFITAATDDDTKTERAKTVMSSYYNALGWEQATIDKTIKNLETGGALLTMAETTLPEFIKMKDKQKAIVDENNIREKTNTDTKIKEYNTKLLSIIDTAEAIGPFEFKSKKEREQLKEYLFVPKVDIGNGKMVPQFAVDRQKASNNPLYTLFQAMTYLNKGIDLSKVEDAAAAKTKRTLKEKLEGAVQNNKIERTAGSSADQNNQRTTISEMLDFDNIVTM